MHAREVCGGPSDPGSAAHLTESPPNSRHLLGACGIQRPTRCSFSHQLRGAENRVCRGPPSRACDLSVIINDYLIVIIQSRQRPDLEDKLCGQPGSEEIIRLKLST